MPRRDPLGECCHVAFHRPAKLNERENREIVFTAFDPSNVASIQVGFVRQPFLRHADAASSRANALSENVQTRIHLPMSLLRGLSFHGLLIPFLILLLDHVSKRRENGMFEIAGGILIAVGVIAVLVAFPTAVMFLVSGAFCLGIAAAAWYFLAFEVGQPWATAVTFTGIAMCVIPWMIASLVEARAVAQLKNKRGSADVP